MVVYPQQCRLKLFLRQAIVTQLLLDHRHETGKVGARFAGSNHADLADYAVDNIDANHTAGYVLGWQYGACQQMPRSL